MSAVTGRAAPFPGFDAPDWLVRAARRIRDYPEVGWLTVALAVLVSAIVAWSLENAHWVPELPGLPFAVAVGAALGLINARHRWNHVAQHAAAFVIAVTQVFAQTQTIVVAASIEGSWLSSIYRMTLWTQALLEGGASTDRLTFVFLLLFAAWAVSYATVWLTLTLRTVWATLPAGFAIITNLTYLPPNSLPWFMAFLFAAALLIVRLVHLERRREWRDAAAAQGRWLSAHIMHAGLWFALIVFLLTAFTPSLGSGPQFIRSFWAELRAPVGEAEGTFTRIFASLPSRRSMGLFGFTDELPFRGNISLPNNVLMHVESDERLYWRARTYDRYGGWGWSTGPLVRDERRGLEDLAGESYADCPECIRNVTFELKAPSGTVFTAATPLRTTLPVEARYNNLAVDEGHRLVKLESQGVLQPNQRYTVQAYVPNVTVEQLNAVEPVYDDWLTETHLALPEDIPFRITLLAQSVTNNAETPYAKAIAIREFLRTLEYSQDISAPPPGVDGLSHFLFGERAGYSEYFGSAMTVLLRSVGVPARLAVGYLPGEYDEELGAFVVLESDLHAWSEAYFPGYGWIPFEPTPNVDAGVPGGPVDAESSFADLGISANPGGDLSGFIFEDAELLQVGDEEIVFEEEFQEEGVGGALPSIALTNIGPYAGGVAAVILVVALFLLWRQALARPRAAAQAYAQTVRLGRLAGVGARPDETPEEYIRRLAVAAPGAEPALYAVAHWYGRALYGPDKQAPPDRPFSWLSIVGGLLALAILRFVPRGRARARRRVADAGQGLRL